MVAYGRTRHPGKVDPLAIKSPLLPPPSISWHAAYWASDPDWSNPGDGLPVSSWRDYSGNGRTLSQATESKRPIFEVESLSLGQSAVKFDGDTDLLSASWSSFPQPSSFVLILDVPTLPTSEDRFLSTTGGKQSIFAYTHSSVLKWHVGAETSQMYGSAVATGTHGVRGKVHGASSGISVDGSTPGTGVDVGSGGNTGVALGGYYAGGYTAAASIAFAAVYSGDVTGAANWSAFCAWAASSYGVTLA